MAGGTVESYADESADLHMDSTFGFDSLTSALSVLLLRTVTDGEFLLDVAADELANWSARLQDACRLKSGAYQILFHCVLMVAEQRPWRGAATVSRTSLKRKTFGCTQQSARAARRQFTPAATAATVRSRTFTVPR